MTLLQAFAKYMTNTDIIHECTVAKSVGKQTSGFRNPSDPWKGPKVINKLSLPCKGMVAALAGEWFPLTLQTQEFVSLSDEYVGKCSRSCEALTLCEGRRLLQSPSGEHVRPEGTLFGEREGIPPQELLAALPPSGGHAEHQQKSEERSPLHEHVDTHRQALPLSGVREGKQTWGLARSGGREGKLRRRAWVSAQAQEVLLARQVLQAP